MRTLSPPGGQRFIQEALPEGHEFCQSVSSRSRQVLCWQCQAPRGLIHVSTKSYCPALLEGSAHPSGCCSLWQANMARRMHIYPGCSVCSNAGRRCKVNGSVLGFLDPEAPDSSAAQPSWPVLPLVPDR